MPFPLFPFYLPFLFFFSLCFPSPKSNQRDSEALLAPLTGSGAEPTAGRKTYFMHFKFGPSWVILSDPVIYPVRENSGPRKKPHYNVVVPRL